ncbi:hypothetical protein IMZ48_44685, partial [Candidatus Bathyarchaeota archaeon]|nr:hypothetical protein [Candidatus Bathyarchaeota archaeon]
MRVEEKESQGVALRPSPTGSKSSGGEDEKSEKSESSSGKPAASPDGASFQEVEL